ncbi:adhesive plaque matrix protein-like isoform X2 [Penaeus indicus]|uniref:adhesive plaque matrix protein-like isoform X1 n=1 Tax=Penaeus indicus TaxID=29960 RepID=UPI00300D900C
MSSLKCLTTVILFGLCVTPSETRIGQKCSTRYDCVSGPGTLTSEVCTDDFCTCSSTAVLQLDEYSFAPECDTFLYLKTAHCSNTHTIGVKECPPNSKCLKTGRCHCNDGYEFVGSNCVKVLYQKVMEPCHIQNGSAYVCDLNQHSFCGEKKCVCFDTYLPNIKSGRCEPEADFLRDNNLTKYVVLHGEYCKKTSHCTEGLECRNYACSCPSPCIYKKDMLACDCGESVSSTGPLLVGILGGLIIIIFWTWTIRNTWRRHTKKRVYQDNAPAAPSVEPSTASYPLAPVTSSGPTAPLLSQEKEDTMVTPDETDFGKIPAESYPLVPPAQPFQSPANSQYPSSQGFPSNAYNDAPAAPFVQPSTASYPLAPVTSSEPTAPLLSQEKEGTGVTPDETDFGKIPAKPAEPPTQPLGFQTPANSQYPSSQGFPSNAYNDAYLPDVSAPPAEASADPSAPLWPPILPPPPYSATTHNPPYAPSSSPPPYPADMPAHPPSSLPPSYPS